MKYYDRYWLSSTSEELGDFAMKWPVIRIYIPKHSSQRILDYGCGKGRILKEVKRLNPRAELGGVDVSAVALRAAKKTLKDVQFHKITDGSRVPLRNGSLDFIIALDVIEHVYDTEQMFHEFTRMLKKGGKILISTPFCGIIKNILVTMIDYELVYDPLGPHVRYYTKKSLTKCLEDSGFECLEWNYFGRFYPIYKGMVVLARKTEDKYIRIKKYANWR